MRGIFYSLFVSGPKMVTFVSFIIFIATSNVSSFNPEQVFFMIGKGAILLHVGSPDHPLQDS